LAPVVFVHLELLAIASTGERRSRIDVPSVHMMPGRQQPITQHNSTFRDITLARICNRLQIPEHARTCEPGSAAPSWRDVRRHTGCRARALHL